MSGVNIWGTAQKNEGIVMQRLYDAYMDDLYTIQSEHAWDQGWADLIGSIPVAGPVLSAIGTGYHTYNYDKLLNEMNNLDININDFRYSTYDDINKYNSGYDDAKAELYASIYSGAIKSISRNIDNMDFSSMDWEEGPEQSVSTDAPLFDPDTDTNEPYGSVYDQRGADVV